jgi:hypothetical protein
MQIWDGEAEVVLDTNVPSSKLTFWANYYVNSAIKINNSKMYNSCYKYVLSFPYKIFN